MMRITEEALKARLGAFIFATTGSLAIPALVVFGVAWLRHRLGPGDDAVVMWWPVTPDAALIPMVGGLFAAVVLGVMAAARSDGKWWRVVRWPWLALAAAGLVPAILSLNSDVRVFPDRVVATADDGRFLKRGVLTFDAAERVEVHCRILSRRRGADVATLRYAVLFPGGQRVDLDHGRDGFSHQAAQRWFDVVERLDRTALATAPHGPGGPAHPLRCVQQLRAQLDEVRFAAARRMLGVTDDQFTRYYAEPHEAFRREG